jgi:hypothetical protein
MIGAIAVLVIAVTIVVLGHSFIGNVRAPGEQRRHALAVWAGHLIGFALIPCAVLLVRPYREPADVLILYPLWVILAGTTFFALAANAGVFYLIGTGCFLLALVMAWEPSLAPLEVGLLMTVNLTVQGVFLRRLRRKGEQAGAEAG